MHIPQDIDEQTYVDKTIIKLYRIWLKRLVILTISLIMLFALADLYMDKRLFVLLFPARVIFSILFLSVLFSTRLIRTRMHQYFHLFYGTILAAATLQVLTLLEYPYYAHLYYGGYYLVVIGLLGFLPLRHWVALSSITLVYAIFLIPAILIHPENLNSKPFAMINIYFIACCIMCYVLRIVQQRNIETNLRMQYRIEREKESLRDYSSILKGHLRSQESKMQQTSILLKNIIENANDGIFISNEHGIVQTANVSAENITGLSKDALIGRDIHQIFGELSEQQDYLQYQKGKWEVTLTNAVGKTVYCEIVATQLNMQENRFLVYFCRDYTARRKMQQQLFLSKKMESIGTLAGGMAHDFKNVLATIMGFVDFIKHSENKDDIKQVVGIVETEITKASTIISQLLQVGRRSQAEFTRFYIDEIVEPLVYLFSNLWKHIRFVNNLELSKYAIYGNKGLLEQVISNMLLNAHDAIHGHGTIIISSTMLPELWHNPQLSAATNKKFVSIEIEDTGCGIPEDILPKIFDPFFTTKHGVDSTKKGSGLGLAMAYGIVKEHGGDIYVESKVHVGTKFTINLPLAVYDDSKQQTCST